MVHAAVGMGYGQNALAEKWVQNDGEIGPVGEAAEANNDSIITKDCNL